MSDFFSHHVIMSVLKKSSLFHEDFIQQYITENEKSIFHSICSQSGGELQCRLQCVTALWVGNAYFKFYSTAQIELRLIQNLLITRLLEYHGALTYK